MSYDAFRHFADSWGLVFLALLYLSFIGWAFLPGSRARNERARTMIFDGDDSHG